MQLSREVILGTGGQKGVLLNYFPLYFFQTRSLTEAELTGCLGLLATKLLEFSCFSLHTLGSQVPCLDVYMCTEVP